MVVNKLRGVAVSSILAMGVLGLNHASADTGTGENTAESEQSMKEYYEYCKGITLDFPDGVDKAHPAYDEKMDKDKNGVVCEPGGWNNISPAKDVTERPTESKVGTATDGSKMAVASASTKVQKVKVQSEDGVTVNVPQNKESADGYSKEVKSNELPDTGIADSGAGLGFASLIGAGLFSILGLRAFRIRQS